MVENIRDLVEKKFKVWCKVEKFKIFLYKWGNYSTFFPDQFLLFPFPHQTPTFPFSLWFSSSFHVHLPLFSKVFKIFTKVLSNTTSLFEVQWMQMSYHWKALNGWSLLRCGLWSKTTQLVENIHWKLFIHEHHGSSISSPNLEKWTPPLSLRGSDLANYEISSSEQLRRHRTCPILNAYAPRTAVLAVTICYSPVTALVE